MVESRTVSVCPLMASPSRKDAKELPLLNDVSPGTLVPRKLKLAWPAMFCSPNPVEGWVWKLNPNLKAWFPRV